MYQPRVDDNPGAIGGRFSTCPLGVILHGSRSGRPQPVQAEYEGTRRFAQTTELGWNATIGEDAVAVHMGATAWGWNARAASRAYLAVEFAQPTVDSPITDRQVRAFVWWLRNRALTTWPNLPLVFPTHAEVEARGLTGTRDGKSDVYPLGSPWADELRDRIRAELSRQGGGEEDTLSTEERAELAELREKLRSLDSYTSSLVDDTLRPVAQMLDEAVLNSDWSQVESARESIRTNVGV